MGEKETVTIRALVACPVKFEPWGCTGARPLEKGSVYTFDLDGSVPLEEIKASIRAAGNLEIVEPEGSA